MGIIEKQTNTSQDEADRLQEVKDFDETKVGVKGLVDSGSEAIPRIFIRTPDQLLEDSKYPCVKRQVPVIDFQGIGTKERYDEIVEEVLYASENWGFFTVVNHGFPLDVMDKMLEGIKMFHEQDAEAKKVLYTRDFSKPVVYNSNFDLYKSRAANWRDSLFVSTIYSGHLDLEALPEICRDAVREYIDHVSKLSDVLLELLSVALGLKPDHLKEMECDKGWMLANHYYPACPAPELTIGTSEHTDAAFVIILLQDQIGGLQVLNENQWVDVQPIPGAFVVNIGDILQMMSNDKFKSVLHRVTANHIGPRISVAYFLKGILSCPKLYGPIKELSTEANPPLYREFTLSEFHTKSLSEQGLDKFKLQNLGDGK